MADLSGKSSQEAVQRKCTTYGELAKVNGVEWVVARHQMNGPGRHLDQLLDLCRARDLPLLPAICVNQGHVADCELEGKALAGFVTGARRLGFLITDERAFHHQCRDDCWRWGAAELAENLREQ